MKVFWGQEGFEPGQRPVVTLGTFDGVHLGHKHILDQVVSTARSVAAPAVLITFHPHPRTVLRPEDHWLRLLTTLDEKLPLLERLGLDAVWVLPFDQNLAALPGPAFISQYLVNRACARHVIIGYDHRFGSGRSGGLTELQEASAWGGFTVEEIPAHAVDHANVSSTKIRQALEGGHLEQAQRLLGYPYFMMGRVIKGQQLGRELGFPTANLQLTDPLKLIPPLGVYAVWAQTGGGRLPAVMSIGTNPTVSTTADVKLEVHLMDFTGDLYGQSLEVQFIKRLRPEWRFETLSALQEQIASDVIEARLALC